MPQDAWLYVAGSHAAALERGARAAGLPAARIRRFDDVPAMAAAVSSDARRGDLDSGERLARDAPRARGGSARSGIGRARRPRRGGEGLMFYHFLYPLHEHFAPFNVFRYITFRSAYALATALLIALVLGQPVIAKLRALKVGQKVRDDGPQSHLPKAGTPTMGGVLIVISILASTLLWGNLAQSERAASRSPRRSGWAPWDSSTTTCG